MPNNQFFDIEGLDFEYKAAGTLRNHIRCVGNANCIGLDTVWCKHIEAIFKDRKDLDFIWSQDWPDVVIYVPVFPTSDVWELVYLNKYTEDGSIYVVKYDIDDQPLDDGKLLTTLSPGEGRREIRTSLWDVASADHKRICGSSAHNMQAELAWQNSVRGSQHHLNVWSVFKTGMCLACNSVLDDMGDLIPDRTNSF